MSHQNIHGECPSCEKIIDRYPDFDADLRMWFDSVRSLHFDAHVSCAGRGKVDQEVAFSRGASHAHYGESAHNYNAAIDLWQQTSTGVYALPKDWFEEIMKYLPSSFTWYGNNNPVFYELPHVEVAEWRVLVKTGALKLVE